LAEHRKARRIAGLFFVAGGSAQIAYVATGVACRKTIPRLSVQAAKQPDQQNDRQRNSDKPKQKSTSHGLPHCKDTCHENARLRLRFHSPIFILGGRQMRLL
jgi:hypothetical protein